MDRGTQRSIIITLIVAACVVGLGLAYGEQSYPSQVCFLSVGQGDASVIMHEGVVVVVDAGSDDALMGELASVLPFSERVIDLAIMTHPHADHIAGFPHLFEVYAVRHGLLTNVAYASKTYERVRALFTSVPHTIVTQPFFFEWEGLRIETLFPQQSFAGVTVKEVNDTSIITLVSFGEFDVLLMADAESSVERALVPLLRNRSIELMTSPHHGSASSSTEEFLDAANPSMIVIPVGPNSYGHPHETILERYHRRHIPFIRTDEEGTVCFALMMEAEGLKRTR